MSFALHPPRSLFPTFSISILRNVRAWTAIPSLTISPPFSFGLPHLRSVLELFPPFLLAVPKKKVSHSRKAMRSANKGLKDKTNIVHCPGCGSPKLAHHLCPSCYSQISRGYKREARSAGQQGLSRTDIVEVD